jgi:hypothetical protein
VPGAIRHKRYGAGVQRPIGTRRKLVERHAERVNNRAVGVYVTRSYEVRTSDRAV